MEPRLPSTLISKVPESALCASILRQGGRTQRDGTVQLFTRRATQTSDAIADQQTKEARTNLLETQVANKRVSLNSSALSPQLQRCAVCGSGFVQRRDTACNDRAAHSVVRSTDTSWEAYCQTRKVSLRSNQQRTEKRRGENRDSTLLPQQHITASFDRHTQSLSISWKDQKGT